MYSGNMMTARGFSISPALVSSSLKLSVWVLSSKHNSATIVSYSRGTMTCCCVAFGNTSYRVGYPFIVIGTLCCGSLPARYYMMLCVCVYYHELCLLVLY